ncbi:transcription elongation factor A N-terminal and central domain-containing protein isoform X2 [Mixophyes fleayi]
MLDAQVIKQLTFKALQVERLLNDRNYEEIAYHLSYFETAKVSFEILQQNDAVRVVYRVLKSSPEGALKRKAKRLLCKWKLLYKDSCNVHISRVQDKCTGEHSSDNSAVTFMKQIQHHGQKTLVLGSTSHVYSANENQKEAMQNQMSSTQTLCCNQLSVENPGQQKRSVEDLRTKCRELLYRALMESADCQEENAQAYVKEVEESIYTMYAGNEKKYRSCIRSKVSNLKNPKNLHLKKLISSGALSPKTFAGMNAMEMASEELRNLRASYTQACVQEHQLPQCADGVQTNKIKCRKCEKFDSTVTMISRGTLFLPGWVRSGNPDEEMMTFVTCNSCGEKWYHNRWICL